MGTGGKLWNKNFSILWQGQFISDLGNGIFLAVLSFWILKLTGSTIMMGTILACLSIPRVLFGPFAGAFADRHSRKWIIVTADLIRGVLFTVIGLAAVLMDKANISFPSFILYPMAIISGICSAFFSPAIISAIPDIVPLDKLTKANSLRTFSQSCSSLVGYALGGVLYSLLRGAPVLVFGYGICFLYASFTQFFMQIPNLHHFREQKHIFREMIDGLKYTFSQKGISALIITGMFLNFFAIIGVTLLAPLFKYEKGYGEAMYGAVMATMMIGQLLGMAFVSFVKLKSKDRPVVFFLSVAALVGGMIPVGLVNNVFVMFPLALIIGMAVAIMTILLFTLLQITVHAENRGRVFGIMSTVFEGLNPLAMIVSGFLAALFSVRPTIVGAFACAGVVLLFAFFNRPFRVFLKSEPLPEALDEHPAQEVVPV
jgi:MFS transporter, DHA3 family, macrolide efflux protein